MVNASRIQTLLTCAKAQESSLILPDGFSVGYIRLGTRLPASLHEELHPDWLPTQNVLVTRKSARREYISMWITVWKEESQGSCSKVQESATHPIPLSSVSRKDLKVIRCLLWKSKQRRKQLTVYPVCKMNWIVPMLQFIPSRLKLSVWNLSPNLFFKVSQMNFIQHYTGLPNFKVVKTIFDFAVGEQFHGITKLTAKVALLKLWHIGSCNFSIFNFFPSIQLDFCSCFTCAGQAHTVTWPHAPPTLIFFVVEYISM